MDSFEQLMAFILERQKCHGYWVRTCVKIELTREDKRAIHRPTCPRWELDVVGYSGRDNELLVLECKSFLDSRGVVVDTFVKKRARRRGRYKLFFDQKLRHIVLRRLHAQLVKQGFCPPKPRVRFGLAAGNVSGDEAMLSAHFRKKRWELWTPTRIREALRLLRDSDYENSQVAVVAKLLLREEGTVVAKNDAELRIYTALVALLHRGRKGSFVLITEPQTKKFVQVGKGRHLGLDVPCVDLSRAEADRASKFFRSIGEENPREYDARDPKTGKIHHGATFNHDFDQDAQTAAKAALAVFVEVYGFPSSVEVSIEEY